MKISQVCAIALLLVVGSMMAHADGITDPKVIIHGVSGGGNIQVHCPPGGCTNVGLNFNFSVPAGGSGTLFFTNASGVNWTSLVLVEKGNLVPAGAIKCNSNLFMSCTATDLKNGNVAIILAGIKGGNNPDRGILNGQSFSIQFACVKTGPAQGCWTGGINFSGHANVTAVPEPGTIALMVTGLGALVSRRKTWKNRWNS
jgi:hypothetical protein